MSLKIMVVDNEPATRESLRTILEPLQCSVVLVPDSREAYRIIEFTEFDSIFLNVNMPHVSGLKLTQEIRASELHQKTPMVMLAGPGDQEPMQACFKAGATLSLAKPITPKGVRSLFNLLRGLIAARQTGAAEALVEAKPHVKVDALEEAVEQAVHSRQTRQTPFPAELMQ